MSTYILIYFMFIVFLWITFANGTMIRLKGNGSSNYQGRVEIYYIDEWGTICDDGWDNNAANVICRMLGFVKGGQVTREASFGQGYGKIWLDDVRCLGTENDISECSHPTWGSHNCRHSEDAGVICIATVNLDVILVNGTNPFEGRVEVYNASSYYDGTWGTICGSTFGKAEADSICKSLGHRHGGEPLNDATFGEGTGSVLLGRMRCNEGDRKLSDCEYNYTTSNCSHAEDAGVICISGEWSSWETCSTTCDNGFQIRSLGCEFGATLCANGTENRTCNLRPCKRTIVRLQGNDSTNFKGRVEVYFNGIWGTICDDGWDDNAANVICRMLGFVKGGQSTREGSFGQGYGKIWLDDVRCLGTEDDIVECSHQALGSHNCGHSEDAGVICMRTVNLEARLVNGSNPFEGRVEIYNASSDYEGTWGTICGSTFGKAEADAICKSLGHRHGGEPRNDATFGEGTGFVLLDQVRCNEGDRNLRDCEYNYSTSNCSHAEDAGVTCISAAWSSWEACSTTCDNGFQIRRLGCDFEATLCASGTENRTCNLRPCKLEPVRLVGDRATATQGRVEVLHNGIYGTICDDSWDDNDATVICRMLEFLTDTEVLRSGEN